MVSKESETELKKDSKTMDNYSFNLLREEAVDIDSFEDQTHEKIAETLFQIIKKETNGLTIGLEGTWGSGKSVVISILKKKLNDDKNIPFFYFDAWAHEGDPLRRIFLESLIEYLFTEKKEENKEVEELKKQISKKNKNCNIHTTRSVTGLGRLLTLATLMVPIGLGFFQKIYIDKITYKWTGDIYWSFWMSLLMFAPLIVIFGNYIRLKLNPESRVDTENGKKYYRKVWDPKNWCFLQGDSTEDITQNTSEDEEKSSIEFENYFEQILKNKFNNKHNEKIIMVIDNLDRIDPHDSLKIWSTLQTFVPQRDKPNKKNTCFDKIWIIVPYDPQGLAKLWDKNEETTEDKEAKKNKVSVHFFDKCFQLKIEVPKPILTTWEKFALDKIQVAFPHWGHSDQYIIFNILEKTRKTLIDIPTPRQIKNYINQVGLLRMHCDKDIELKHIAYYVVQRILEINSVDEIREKLLKGELPDRLSKQFLEDNCSRDMAGIIFGVDPIKGQQLLLEPDIENALSSGNGEVLKKLQDTHLNGFWGVFNHHLRKNNSFIELLHYSKAICDSLWNSHQEKLVDFCSKIKTVIASQKEFPWPENGIDEYQKLAMVLNSQSHFDRIYNGLIISIDKKIGTINQSQIGQIAQNLQEIVTIFNIKEQKMIASFNDVKFIQWSQECYKTKVPAWKWIIPQNPLADHIASKIPIGRVIPIGIYESINYLINARYARGLLSLDIEDWSSLLMACQKHIQHNNGNGILRC
jgi:hypothetical protein